MSKDNPRISVVIPFHWMENWTFFLNRCLKSVELQTFKDYEVILVNHSTMPVTSNRAIESAKGEIVKVLYMDDYLVTTEALQNLSDSFTGGWQITGCVHDDGTQIYNPHPPVWSEDVLNGVNTLGSPSVLAFENKYALLFDERMSWMLDLDLYRRLFERYGAPQLTDTLDIAIGVGAHQMTHKLTDTQKLAEEQLFHGNSH